MAEFEAVIEAEKEYNIGGIYACLSGERNYAGIHPTTKQRMVWMDKEEGKQLTREEKNIIIDYINDPDNYLFGEKNDDMIQELTANLNRDNGDDNESIKRDIKDMKDNHKLDDVYADLAKILNKC